MIGAISNTNVTTVSRKYEKSLKLFFLSFIADQFFAMMASDSGVGIPFAISQGLQIVCLVTMFSGAAGILRYQFDNAYLKSVFTLFMTYSIFVSFNGARYDYNSLKYFILNGGTGLLAYLTPLSLLMGRNFEVYKRTFNTQIVFGFFFLLFVVLFFDILRNPDRTNLNSLGYAESIGSLSRPLGFFLLTFFYHGKPKDLLELGKKNIFALVIMLITLYFAVYRARRGMIFSSATILISFIGFYFAYSRKKAVPIAVFVLAVGAIGIYIASHGTPSMMQFVLDRGDEDTRSGVEDYFYDDMSTTDMIFGRGINGRYYCPTVENVMDEAGDGYRDNIETGYLNIILKGGLVSLVLLGMILAPAIFLGFFKSRNLFSKASAIWIFWWIIYQYPMNGVGFSLYYITIWVAVGICYSKNIRMMSDKHIHFQMMS